ncbi:hypothetical protein B9Z55_016111 [Caenorhabditis nigoni]|uniref:Caspase family p20 domain-containing protein n=2 Tax=Caenorhabditis nigoni TaxID=1611254 RepID=A0A2G5UD82_9PELO|nr:hypothetical protein B9Z55_016111 [Caenorhabditis nigoni]
MVNAETVVKKRHYNKKERAKRRKQLGLHEESEARKTKEFCQKVKERTQNMQEFLKMTGRNPSMTEQRLLNIGGVVQSQQNNGNESVEHGIPLPEKSSDDKDGELNEFWLKFGTEQVEGECETPNYADSSAIFSNQKMSIGSSEKSQVDVHETIIGRTEDMGESEGFPLPDETGLKFSNKTPSETENMEIVENLNLTTTPEGPSAHEVSEKILENSEVVQGSEKSEILDEIEQECLTDSQMTVNSDYTDNLAEPLYIEEPAKSDEHSSKNEEEEELLNQLYGQLNIPERINGESDVIDMDNSDEQSSTKEPSAQRNEVFSDMIQAMREEKKRDAEKKLIEELSEEPKKKPPAQKGRKSRVPKVPAKKTQVKHLKTATASKMKSASTLDEYEIEAMRKVGITIRKPEDQVPKDQYDEKIQKLASNVINGSLSVYKNVRKSMCLVIAISDDFEGDGMNRDIENISTLFQKLNYLVCICRNLTAREIGERLKMFAEDEDHGDSVILFFLVHGTAQGMVAADKQIFETRRVFEYLKPANAPRLAGKPKLVFFEQCRGTGSETGYVIIQDTKKAVRRSGRAHESAGKAPTTIPKFSDVLISHATMPGYYAYANGDGAYHIQNLVQTISERAHESHLEEMLVEVRRRVCALDIDDEEGTVKQMPMMTSTLTKRFFFNTNSHSQA